MALKQISTEKSGGSFSYEEGTVIKGYFVEVRNRKAKTKDGKSFMSPDLILKTEGGEERAVFPVGNLKYFQDDYVKKHAIKPGTWIEITCTKGGDKPRFDNVAIDDEKTIKVETRSEF